MDSNQSFIDLRSDTITRAPKQMLQAMRVAEIRCNFSVDCLDDVACTYFQENIAQMFGKQAALFFPTATMANLAAVMLHTSPGSEIIISSNSHAVERQSANYALFAGVQTRQIVNQTGLFTADQVKKRTRKQSQHVTFPNTDLVYIENGTYRGRAWSLDSLKQIKEVAESLKLKVHIDGTRIFNALAHFKLKPNQISNFYDTITVCLTKGLACPIGAVVTGSKSDIAKMKSIRKALGGGLWHPGLLTAAASYSLQHILPEIEKDNQIAQRLAEQLFLIKEIKVNPSQNDLNMVFWSPKNKNFDHQKFFNYLLEHKIKIKRFDQDYRTYRFVTHYHIREEEIRQVLLVLRKYFENHE